MNCRKCEKYIVDYLENRLTGNKRQSVEEHLASCIKCVRLVEEVEQTFKISGQDKVREVNPFFYTRVMQRIKSSAPEARPVSFSVRWAINTAVYTMIVIVGFSLGVFLGLPSKSLELSRENEQLQNISEQYYLNEHEHAYYAQDYIENILVTGEE